MGEVTYLNFPFPYGAYSFGREMNGIRISFPSEEEDCGVLVYQRGSGRLLKKYAFRPQDRLGNIRYGVITGVSVERISYLFYSGNKVFPDRWARAFELRGKYGAPHSPRDYRAVIQDVPYDWEGDVCPKIPYEDVVCYGMHVRGFTMHSSSGVRNRGTFAGIGEKLDYLQQLGITTIELQPIYEQIESERLETESMDAPWLRHVATEARRQTGMPEPSPKDRFEPEEQRDIQGQPGLSDPSKTRGAVSAELQEKREAQGEIEAQRHCESQGKDSQAAGHGKRGPQRRQEVCGQTRLNYWGYQEGYYYAPKRGYAATDDAATELKDLVKALHARGMEIVLQFYFPDHIPTDEILNVLRYWSWTYHVDGFHLMGGALQSHAIASDPALCDRKLWYYDFPTEQIYGYEKTPGYRNLAVYNEGFQQDMRRFLKGDEGMLYAAMQRMRCNPRQKGMINYFADYAGFTMMDMVSYDRKHNEENGENNRDGSDCNHSWNCGAEGPSRKKQIQALRMKQLRNAFTLLILSQGTPYFFMGDEFGRTQKGNNNPYCQDNPVTWVNWNELKRHGDLYTYVQNLICLRRQHSIFHLERECRLMDYISCGSPDLSYHGSEAWRPAWEAYNRHIGILLNGVYGREKDEGCWYIAVNMHWESHDFALPRLSKGQFWRKVLCTETGQANREDTAKAQANQEKERELAAVEGQVLRTGPRSITVYYSGNRQANQEH